MNEYTGSDVFEPTSEDGIAYINDRVIKFIKTTDHGNYLINLTNDNYSLIKTDSTGSTNARVLTLITLASLDIAKTGEFNSQSTSILKCNDNVSLVPGKLYYIQITMELECNNYDALIGIASSNISIYHVFYSIPSYDPNYLIDICALRNPLPFVWIEGRTIISATTYRLNLSFVRTGIKDVQHQIRSVRVVLVQ